jgi:hypothetical protein
MIRRPMIVVLPKRLTARPPVVRAATANARKE